MDRSTCPSKCDRVIRWEIFWLIWIQFSSVLFAIWAHISKRQAIIHLDSSILTQSENTMYPGLWICDDIILMTLQNGANADNLHQKMPGYPSNPTPLRGSMAQNSCQINLISQPFPAFQVGNCYNTTKRWFLNECRTDFAHKKGIWVILTSLESPTMCTKNSQTRPE